MRYLKVSAIAIALVCGATASSAATLNLNSIDTGFHDPAGGTDVTTATQANGNSSVSWGVPADTVEYLFGSIPIITQGEQSGYEMDVTGAPSSVMDDTQFQLAEFTHNNNIIERGSSITGVTLDVTLDLSVDFEDGDGFQDLGEQTFTFDIDHNETQNNPSDGICDPNGSSLASDPLNANGCADVVDIMGVVGSNTIIVGEYEFTLNIVGFLDPSTGEISQSFYSMEENSNSRILIATFSVRRITTEVPVPASGLLLLGGLAGVGALRRRRKK